jgi:hypothetical protein
MKLVLLDGLVVDKDAYVLESVGWDKPLQVKFLVTDKTKEEQILNGKLRVIDIPGATEMNPAFIEAKVRVLP